MLSVSQRDIMSWVRCGSLVVSNEASLANLSKKECSGRQWSSQRREAKAWSASIRKNKNQETKMVSGLGTVWLFWQLAFIEEKPTIVFPKFMNCFIKGLKNQEERVRLTRLLSAHCSPVTLIYGLTKFSHHRGEVMPQKETRILLYYYSKRKNGWKNPLCPLHWPLLILLYQMVSFEWRKPCVH